MSDSPTYSQVLANRSFKFLWINQILVQFAYNTLNFALLIWVFKLVDTNLAVSALILSIYLPTVFFGILSGVIADRTDKRKIIMLVDICLALLFLSYVFTKNSLPLILINTFLVNTLAQFFIPAESSLIPKLVSKKQLFLAISLFSLTFYSTVLIGFSLGGPLLHNFGIDIIFILGCVILIIAFLLSQNLPSTNYATKNMKVKSLLSVKNLKWIYDLTVLETKQTVKFLKGRPPMIAAIFLLSIIQGIIGVLSVLLPSYLERILKIHAEDSSYFMLFPLGLGIVLGAYLVGKFFNNQPKRSIVIPAILGAGFIFILMGIAPSLAEYFRSPELPSRILRLRNFFLVPSLSTFFALGSFLLGLFTISIIIPAQAVLQEYTNSQNRGKIFSVLAVFTMSFSALPIFLSGVLSDLFGVTPIFIALGIITFIAGFLAFRPNFFFAERHLPIKIRQFLGLGHWVRLE